MTEKAYDEKQITVQLADQKLQRRVFSAIVQQYSEPLYWKIRRIVLTHEDTHDVLQNA